MRRNFRDASVILPPPVRVQRQGPESVWRCYLENVSLTECNRVRPHLAISNGREMNVPSEGGRNRGGSV